MSPDGRLSALSNCPATRSVREVHTAGSDMSAPRGTGRGAVVNPPEWPIVLAAAGAVAFVALMSTGVDLVNEMLALPLILLVAAGACGIARQLAAARWVKPITAIGANSMVYYLVHYPVMIGIGAVLVRFDVRHSFLLVPPLQMGAGLGCACGLTYLARRLTWRTRTTIRPSAATDVAAIDGPDRDQPGDG